MKKILFIFKGECFQMPPFLTIIDSLCNDYALEVLNTETKENRKRLQKIYQNKNVEFIGTLEPDNSKTLSSRIRRRIGNIFNLKTSFYKDSIEIIENRNYDLLWVIHENTICELRDYLINKEFITSIYELRDDRPDMLKKMQKPLKHAKEIMVAEYNRACIFRVWFKLCKTPTVVPNKPYYHPRKKSIQNKYSELLEGKKIILYQGGINEQRKLDVFCRAIEKIEEWTLVLMGDHSTYRDKLQRMYPNIICIDFVAPPAHLEITSYAMIGVVKYDYTFLNHAYCAPNKIWEYTGFGIPVLGNDLPGLEYTVGKYHAGEFVNTEDENEIISAINKISGDYKTYSENAVKFYESYNVKSNILDIVERNSKNL